MGLFLNSQFLSLFYYLYLGQYYIQLKTSIYQMTIKNMKRQTTEWEKIFSKYVSDKSLVSRICKEFPQINEKKYQESDNPMKHRQKYLNMHFLKRTYRWPITIKRCSSSLVISDVQAKTIMYYHCQWETILHRSLMFLHVLQAEVMLSFESPFFVLDYIPKMLV